MSKNLVKNIEADLKSEDRRCFNNAIEATYWIADLYTFGGDANSLDQYAPYRSEIISSVIDESLASEIKYLLRNHVSKCTDLGEMAASIGVLGKFNDTEDIELFEQYLEIALKYILSSNQLLHQTIIALNSQNAIIRPDGSYSLTDVDKNIDLARKHLGTKGKVISW